MIGTHSNFNDPNPANNYQTFHRSSSLGSTSSCHCSSSNGMVSMRSTFPNGGVVLVTVASQTVGISVHKSTG